MYFTCRIPALFCVDDFFSFICFFLQGVIGLYEVQKTLLPNKFEIKQEFYPKNESSLP
jgi:hypothetical protein